MGVPKATLPFGPETMLQRVVRLLGTVVAPVVVVAAREQQLPELPDDLREDALQAVAMARFSIRADGSVEVELTSPTHVPRLNQLLLDALKKWRFFPAMKNGQPIASSQDIRVHFNVD